MSPASQTLLARFAVAVSVFALLMVGVVAVTQSGDDSGGGGGDSAPVAVSMAEFSFAPSTITVPAGGSLQLTNDGTMDHNGAVLDTPILSADIPAGGSEILDLSSLEPGEYELFCTIPGHKDAGMTATLIIAAEGDETAAGEISADDEHIDHGAIELSDLEATDPLAKRVNEELEESMTAGVNEFLAWADKYTAGEVDAGNEILEPEILEDGTKRFELTTAITDWQVSPGKVVKAWTYNERVPGPWIKVDPGDKMEVVVTNDLPISTDVHWHGIDTPNTEDGLAPITQDFIKPGTDYTYSFTVSDTPQLGMFHAHMHGQEAIVNGQFGVIQVGDMELPRGRTINNIEVPADLEIAQEIPMVLNDAGVIGLSLNGKAYPETAPIGANEGDWILLHYYNEGFVGHPMHIHRQPHLVVAKDGYPLAEPYRVDTVWISPGERYSVLIKAEEPGVWAFHCHIVSHAENDDGLFGMVTAMVVN